MLFLLEKLAIFSATNLFADYVIRDGGMQCNYYRKSYKVFLRYLSTKQKKEEKKRKKKRKDIYHNCDLLISISKVYYIYMLIHTVAERCFYGK